MNKLVTRKRALIVMYILIIISILLYMTNQYISYILSQEATISGEISVCIDGENIDPSLIILRCVYEETQKSYAVTRKDTKKKCTYSVITDDKGYFQIQLSVPSHLMKSRTWKEDYVEYDNIHIFNIMGGNVEARIYIDIWQEDGIYKSCCTVAAKAGKDAPEDTYSEERIINQRPSGEIRWGV